MADSNIYLIGPRSCGKTSVGRVLAKRLGRRFADTDHIVVRATGMEIADYVGQNDWESFREKESEALQEVASDGGLVVGCGGGVVLREENRSLLAEGVTLYLQVSPDELVRRLSHDPNEAQRPSLTGRAIADEVRDVLAEREALYLECADIVLQQGSPDEIVEQAMQELERLF